MVVDWDKVVKIMKLFGIEIKYLLFVEKMGEGSGSGSVLEKFVENLLKDYVVSEVEDVYLLVFWFMLGEVVV